MEDSLDDTPDIYLGTCTEPNAHCIQAAVIRAKQALADSHQCEGEIAYVYKLVKIILPYRGEDVETKFV